MEAALSGVEVALDCGCELGEGPFWDGEERRLLWVDVKAGTLHSWSPGDGSRRRRRFDGLLGFAIPRRGGGTIAGVDRRLVRTGPGGDSEVIAEVEGEHPGNRFNDAKCDPGGRLWAGTMSIEREPGVAALYRVEPDGSIDRALDGLTISNGLGWSPDAATMYLIDSTTQRIDAFDFDLAGGRLARRRAFAEIDPGDGLPDGMAVDADGGVWVALFGGGELRRYRADGGLDLRLALPTSNCTCPAFGGERLEDLYLTTAKHKLDPRQLQAQKHAGALLRLRPGRTGLPLTRFAG
ncbi:MAG: SMP-30/gluconolactonase/LRE family protein [Solirubrobacterales bacterium]